jgi:hypothetical protein
MSRAKALGYLFFPLIFFVNSVHAQDSRIVGESGLPALNDFFGDMRGNYIYPDMPVVDQLLEMIIVPQEGDEIRGNYTIRARCRSRSCDQMGAIVYNSRIGRTLAAGLIHHACAMDTTKREGVSCSSTQHVTMFVPFRGKSLDAEILLLEWAHRHLSGAPNGTIFETVTVQSPE